MSEFPTMGVVIIGRNEGERLARCLVSVLQSTNRGLDHWTPLVYVDSGSTDHSREAARRAGAELVDLDMSRPFSAARARNAGFERLREIAPYVDFVQFIDGDCELIPGWIQAATAELVGSPKVAIVCGRLRERFPEASIYNRLCEIEFNRPPGDIAACGGIFMARAGAFHEVGGFNPAVVAGEEPELCLRLRRRGHIIRRLGVDMAWHDSAMTRFGQWWRRAVRSGHAYAQAVAMHGLGPEKAGVRESIGIWFWAVVLPLLAVVPAWWTWGVSLGFLLVYPLQVMRIARRRRELDERRGDRWLFAAACMLAKWPQWWGQAVFMSHWLRRRAPTIIEHKDSAPAAPRPAPISPAGEPPAPVPDKQHA